MAIMQGGSHEQRPCLTGKPNETAAIFAQINAENRNLHGIPLFPKLLPTTSAGEAAIHKRGAKTSDWPLKRGAEQTIEEPADAKGSTPAIVLTVSWNLYNRNASLGG